MSYRHRETRDNFSGGYNSRDKDTHLQDIESPDMRNVMLGKRGGIYTRRGSELFSQEPVATYAMDNGEYPPVTSLYEHINAGGQPQLLAFAGNELKRASAVGGWTLIDDGLMYNSYLNFINHPIINRSLFVNGYDGYWETDGIIAREVEMYNPSHEEEIEIGENVIPNDARFIAYYDNRVWLAGFYRYHTRVYFNVDDLLGNIRYNYFTSWSWINIPSVRGESVTAMKPFKGSLIVFTPTTMKAITTTETLTLTGGTSYLPPSYRMDDVSGNAGTISQRSVHLMQDKLIFLGTDGVYVYDGNTPPYKISHRIEPDIGKLNQTYWNRSTAVTWKDKYVLSMPVGETIVTDTTSEQEITLPEDEYDDYYDYYDVYDYPDEEPLGHV